MKFSYIQLVVLVSCAFATDFLMHAMELPKKDNNALQESSAQLSAPPIVYYYAPWREAYVRTRTQCRPECSFCTEIAENDDQKYRMLRLPEKFIMMVNANPYSAAGTLMIIPHAHVPNLHTLSVELRTGLATILRGLSYLFLKILGYQGYSTGINDGRVAGASVPEHMHMHLLPYRNNPRDTYVTLANAITANAVDPDVQPLYENLREHLSEALSADINHDPQENITQPHCAWCRLVNGHSDNSNLIIVRLKHCLIMFNPTPLVRGHILIVPFVHQAAPHLFAEDVIKEMLSICAELAAICPLILRNEGSNSGINVGRQPNGNVIEHMSVDWVPRWLGDISSLALSHTQIISLDMPKLIERFRELLKQKLNIQ